MSCCYKLAKFGTRNIYIYNSLRIHREYYTESSTISGFVDEKLLEYCTQPANPQSTHVRSGWSIQRFRQDLNARHDTGPSPSTSRRHTGFAYISRSITTQLHRRVILHKSHNIKDSREIDLFSRLSFDSKTRSITDLETHKKKRTTTPLLRNTTSIFIRTHSPASGLGRRTIPEEAPGF